MDQKIKVKNYLIKFRKDQEKKVTRSYPLKWIFDDKNNIARQVEDKPAEPKQLPFI